MIAGWGYPEEPTSELAGYVLDVKKASTVIPMSIEQLLDAGILLPPGMEAPPPYTRKPLPWRVRWRMACANRIDKWRRRVGFWIAGFEPDDEDW